MGFHGLDEYLPVRGSIEHLTGENKRSVKQFQRLGMGMHIWERQSNQFMCVSWPCLLFICFYLFYLSDLS